VYIKSPDHLPKHVHIKGSKGQREIVFELKSGQFIANKKTSKGFTPKEIQLLQKFVNQRAQKILEKWDEING